MSQILAVQAVSKAYGHHPVLHDISFQVAAGTLVGIVGENGAGKSTLLKILAGELNPSQGTIAIQGALGYCPQTVILNDSLTVAQHLDYFRAAYHLTSLARADALITQLHYAAYRQSVVGTLSGGTKQKLNLTLALMHDPTVLLLDEPYQGFDWETYQRFWQVASALRDRGCAVLIVSHLFFDRQRFDALYQLNNGCLEQISREKGVAS